MASNTKASDLEKLMNGGKSSRDKVFLTNYMMSRWVLFVWPQIDVTAAFCVVDPAKAAA